MLNGKAQVKAKGTRTRTFGTSQCSWDMAAMYAQHLLDRKLLGEEIGDIHYIEYNGDGSVREDRVLRTADDYFFA